LKKIIFINQDSGYLTIDIAIDLINNNLDPVLITGRLVTRNNPLPESVKIKKIIKYHRGNNYQKLLSWVIGFIQILFIIKTKYKKDYLLLVSNPPLTTFLPLFCKNKFSLLIFDVYPNVLIQMGIISETSFFSNYWKKINKKIFAKADNIFTLTEGMSALINQYINDKGIGIVPLWGDTSFFKPVPKETNPFILEHKLKNRFVVIYSGNLGTTHNVEILPEIAKRIKNPRVIFLIVGDGDRKRFIEEKVKELNLMNCLFLPLLPINLINFSFASAQIAIVSLSENASGLSLPSKTFSFMSAGLPLLCITGKGSELNRLVEKYDNGRCFHPNELDEIACFIEDIALNEAMIEKFKVNSQKASNDFTSKNAGLITEALIKSMQIH